MALGGFRDIASPWNYFRNLNSRNILIQLYLSDSYISFLPKLIFIYRTLFLRIDLSSLNLMISLSGLSTLVPGATDSSYIRRAHVYVLGSHFSASEL